MSDPFEVWRLACSTAFTRSLDLLGDVFAPYAALSPPQDSYAIDLSSFPTFQRVRLDLDTMFLLEPRRSAASARPVVIVGPYAVHDAAIADFAEGHSLAGALTEEGAGPLALTFWKSATAQMRDYGIDAYLSDLNVAVDDLGGRVSLVGICQGGWLAAA
jgi:poly(3-hydroxybutyrate) depolymerase